jgi:GGDEF domain-containing protein
MRQIPIPALRRPAPPDDPALIARGSEPASGLLTRETLAEVMARRIAAQERFAESFALLVVRLDGAAAPLPPAGARQLRAGIRGSDLLARWDATALAVLLPDPTGEPDANGLAPRLALLARRALGAEGDALACRIASALFPADGWTATTLMDHAEAALLAAAPVKAMPGARPLASAWQREVA